MDNPTTAHPNQTNWGWRSFRGSCNPIGHGRSNSSHGRGLPLLSRPPNSPNPTYLSRPTCHVCPKSIHVVLQCSHRFNHAYQFKPLTTFSANLTCPFSIIDNSWYSDSGVTHHITHELSQLNNSFEPYGGCEHIRVGNGTTLLINNIDIASLSVPSSSFQLCNLLHVLSIKKNLVSISQILFWQWLLLWISCSLFPCEAQANWEAPHKWFPQ